MLAVAIITCGSVTAIADGGVVRGMQGQYLYVGVVGLAVLGLPQTRRARRMALPAAALVATCAAEVLPASRERPGRRHPAGMVTS